MTTALIFDVETTGLLPTTRNPEIPHIIQFSFVLYDIETRDIQKTYNSYVRLPEGVVVSTFITQLTGITQEKIEECGNPLSCVLEEFYRAYEMADLIIGHNVKFDISMVVLHSTPEMKRMFDREVITEKNKKVFCTMRESIDICKLERETKTGKKYYKYPKLSELYEHFFGEIPENLHDSMVDVLACLKCFLKIKGLTTSTPCLSTAVSVSTTI